MAISSPVFRVGADGISAPSYEEILDYFIDKAKGIFGNDINLDADTQDGQLLSIFAYAIHEVNSQAIEVFGAYNPQTAYGIALDGAVKTNGITRRSATKSTAELRIVGQFGTVIKNGIVKDAFGNKWDLPESVTIPQAGEITVTATAEDEGAISASANSINEIATPTRGWQTATNPSPATVGVAVQTDEELRTEQTLSTMQPSLGLWDGLIASLDQVDGVTSVSGVHNDTNQVTIEGIPAHTIAVVVMGGSVSDIVETIYKKKSQGVATYGSVSGDYLDSLGNVTTIKFSRPTNVNVSVSMRIKASARWISVTEDEVKERISEYINSLGVGVDVNIARTLASAIKTLGQYDTSFDVLEIKLNNAVASVSVAWNQIAVCSPSSITITVE